MGYSVYVRSLFFLYGDRANIIRRVPFSIGGGKFVRFQNFELLKISSPNNSGYSFALRSSYTLYQCGSYSTVVLFIPPRFGVTSVPRSCIRMMKEQKQNMHSIPAE